MILGTFGMEGNLSRRGVLTGMAVTAGNLLFRREIFAQTSVPAVGNSHLLTVVAVSERTLRVRVIQQGKQGPAAEIGVVPRAWPDPLQPDEHGSVIWGDYKVRMEERPWHIT